MSLITVKSLKSSSKKSFTAEVSNLGELKSALTANGISYDNSKIILKNTGATLEHDSAILPNEDLLVYIFPVQVKAGGKLADAIQEVIDTMQAQFDATISALENLVEVTEEVEEETQAAIEDAAEGVTRLSEDDLDEMSEYQF